LCGRGWGGLRRIEHHQLSSETNHKDDALAELLTIRGFQVTVEDVPNVWIVSRAWVGVVAVSNGRDELGEQAPDQGLLEFDAILMSFVQALLEVTAFAELLEKRVSSLSQLDHWWRSGLTSMQIHMTPSALS
jgi:hypothetical protein